MSPSLWEVVAITTGGPGWTADGRERLRRRRAANLQRDGANWTGTGEKTG